MTSQEIYKRFLLKLNKNDTNAGVNILPSSFVLIFNAERVIWLGQKFNSDADSWKLSSLDYLLTADEELTKDADYSDSIDFKFPANFFRHASSYCIADKGPCKDQRLYTFEKKPLGFNTILADDFNSPQFKYEETPFIITKNMMKIYFDDFVIKKAYASFYTLPDEIDIAGYEKLDGTISVDKTTNLIPEHINEILDRVVVEVTGSYQDSERYQFVKEKISTEP